MDVPADLLFGSLKYIFQWVNQVELLKVILGHPFMKDFMKIAQKLTLLLLVISITHEMYLKVMDGKGNYSNLIMKSIIIILLLSIFPAVFIKVPFYIDRVSMMFIDTDEVQESFSSYSDVSEKGKEDRSWWQILGNVMGVDSAISESSVLNLFVYATMYASMIIIFVVLIIRAVSLALLTLVAPICFACLVWKNTESYFWGWCKSYFNVIFWPLLIGFILFIQSAILSAFITRMGDVDSEFIEKLMLLIYNVVFILMNWKVMRFIPELQSGRAGSFSTLEGAMTFGAMGMMSKLLGKGNEARKKGQSKLWDFTKWGAGKSWDGIKKGGGALKQRVPTMAKNFNNSVRGGINNTIHGNSFGLGVGGKGRVK